MVQCSVICLFPSSSITPNLSPLTLLAILAIISLQMSLWQRRVAIIKHLLLGLIIGLISTLHPHLILIVLLLPIAGYYMRCLSPRNLLSAITGTALGIWIIYLIVCILPLLGSKEGGIAAADRMIMAYLPPNLSPLISNQVLPLGRGTEGVSLTPLTLYLVLLLFIHTLTSFAVDLGQSVRTEASIIMTTSSPGSPRSWPSSRCSSSMPPISPSTSSPSPCCSPCCSPSIRPMPTIPSSNGGYSSSSSSATSSPCSPPSPDLPPPRLRLPYAHTSRSKSFIQKKTIL